MTQIAKTLPDVLVGPLLRRLSPSRLVLWLVASRPLTMQLVLCPEQKGAQTHSLDKSHQCLAIGQHAYIHFIDLSLPAALPTDERIDYDLQ
ncbi:MAG: alkaline phosphatase family protein, partial [Halomonas venusta]|nr:alkaline phosphatase family protein [Halomonas venusta]